MQPYDCRDLVLCLKNVPNAFEISELILGEIEGDRGFQFRKIRLKTALIPQFPLNTTVAIQHRNESKTLLQFKSTSVNIHHPGDSMEILGEERIESGASPELADASF